MVGSARASGRAAAVLVMSIAAAASVPAPAAAAGQRTVVLPGPTLAASLADLDGDGTDEIVRLVDDGPRIGVEGWRFDDRHGWSVIGPVELDRHASNGIVGDGLTGAGLVRTRVAGGDRVLVMTSRTDVSGAIPEPCCLRTYELVVDRSEMRLVPTDLGEATADTVTALDMDGDGTDELVLSGGRWSGEPGSEELAAHLRVLVRADGAWSTIHEASGDAYGYSVTAGDSDGRPGLEVLVTVGEFGGLERIALVDGVPEIERATLGGEPGGRWVAGVADGSIVSSATGSVEVVRWPAGEPMGIVARERLDETEWVSVLGEGGDALILIHDMEGMYGSVASTEVRDLDLHPLGVIARSTDAARLWDTIDQYARRGGCCFERNIAPFVGPIPGGLPGGRPAQLIGGTVVSPGGERGYEARRAALLVGFPLGLVGPADGWLAVCDGCYGSGTSAYLTVGTPGTGRLSLVPLSGLDGAGGSLTGAVRYEGAVELARGANETTLLARSDGFDLVVAPEPGTIVVRARGSSLDDYGPVDGPLRIQVGREDDRTEGGSDFGLALVFIGPDGIASMHRWSGTFAPEEPELSAEATLAPFTLSATISGEAWAGSSVSVDGLDVALDPSGAYHAVVDAPIWPRDVFVVARDPFGAERTSRLQVVGLVDYRSWPWPWIVGLTTVSLAFVWFARTPGLRGRDPDPAESDATLEEIDLD